MQDGGKRIIYLLNDEERCSNKANYIRQLTDLGVLEGPVETLESLADVGVGNIPFNFHHYPTEFVKDLDTVGFQLNFFKLSNSFFFFNEKSQVI